ncbi:MAG: DUF4864 domain-containing protein [Ideonella sp.]|nr:DUF4864 domain-containing protein [Ideonella sp.]
MNGFNGAAVARLVRRDRVRAGSLAPLRRTDGWTRRTFAGLFFLCLARPLTTRAAALAEMDARAIRQTIEAQLEAFAAGDAARAYAFASAEIQAQFGDADTFMAMVRRGYPMVIRPAAVSFYLPQPMPGAPPSARQRVRLRDPEGRLWIATYLVQRQAGGAWRINGCVVAADDEKSST